jgi:hypothetical protein
MDIIQQVKELIQRDNLDSKDRYRDMIYKRSYLYAILRDEGWHLSKIGRLFKRNHATVINALKIHDQFFGNDKLYDRTIRQYVNELGKFSIQIDEDKPTIFQDIINCHNTTALAIIKQKIKDGYYDKVTTLLLAVPTFFYFFVGGVEKMLVILS